MQLIKGNMTNLVQSTEGTETNPEMHYRKWIKGRSE